MSEIVTAEHGKVEHELDGLTVEAVWSVAPPGVQSLPPAISFRRTPESLRVSLVDPLARRVLESDSEVDSLGLREREFACAELVGAAAHTLTLGGPPGAMLSWLERRWATPHWRGPTAAVTVADIGSAHISVWRAGDGNGHVTTGPHGALQLFSDHVLRDRPAIRNESTTPTPGDRALPTDPSAWLSAPLGFPGAAVESRVHDGEWQEIVLRTGCAPKDGTVGTLDSQECTHVLPHRAAAAVIVRVVQDT